MLLLFKYIVLFFCCFNIANVSLAEVIFDLDEEETELKRTSFIGAGSIPHPVQLRQILERKDSSAISNLLVLGRYFDAKYASSAIDKDLTPEISLIFPELSSQEIADLTDNVKSAIAFYRVGKEKVTEVTQKIITPKDPPLKVADDEYALVGDKEYLPVGENEYAVISDFKKVISYGNNPREIKAFDEKVRREREKKAKKTDFEKFKLMLDKIEFSKLASYGVTLPNPFVGNAGISPWIENNAYRARLISEYARINAQQEFLTALHVDIPNHRLMLALPFGQKLSKPEIHLKNAKNVASYEAFYPLPVQLTSDAMVGIYRGNFAFPIKIKPEKANEPVSFEVEFNFQDCDFELNCKSESFNLSIEIEADETENNVLSSMNQFVRQSFYNLPKEKNKYVTLNSVGFNAEKKQVSFDFYYDAPLKNMALMLENTLGTVFKFPSTIITENHIYANATLEEDVPPNFAETPLTFYLRINNYATLKQTINLTHLEKKHIQKLWLGLLLSGFMLGFLFFLTPFGAPLFLETFFKTKDSFKIASFETGAKFISLSVVLLLALFALHLNADWVYFNLRDNLLGLSFLFLVLFAKVIQPNFEAQDTIGHGILRGILNALWCVAFLLLGITFYQETFLLILQNSDLQERIIALFGLLSALILPDILCLYLFKKIFSGKLRYLLYLFSQMMLIIALGVIACYIIFSLSPKGLLKALWIFGLSCFVLVYIFSFWQALYQTNLKKSQVRATEKVLFVLTLLLMFFTASRVDSLSMHNQKISPIINQAEIQDKINEGKNVLIRFEDEACLLCKYNNFMALNTFNINRLSEQYPFEYITVNTTEMTPQIRAYFKQFQRISAPVYVYFSSMTPNGVLLPKFLTDTTLDTTLKNFAF